MNLPEKYIGSLKGVAIGDALGLPVEIYTRAQIIDLLDRTHPEGHHGLIRGYYPIGQHGMYRRAMPSLHFPELTTDSTGICSDDTILTLAIADSIQARGGVDLDDIIARHIRAVRSEPFGFGTGTLTSMESIAGGDDWRTKRDTSFGNGVMMKQSPLAFHEVHIGRSTSDELIQLAQITHAHPISLVAARVHHQLLVDIVLSGTARFDMGYWLQQGVRYAQQCEKEYQAGDQVSTLMTDIRTDSDSELSLEDMGKAYARKIDNEKNPYFNILSTLGIVYAIFLRQQDFRAVQQGASIGGDTDSYASILGGMVGALQGDMFDPYYYNNLHPRYRIQLDATMRSIDYL